MTFHWSMNDSKSPQVSKTLFSILVDLNSAVVWMVSAGSPISNSSNLFIRPLEIVPGASSTVTVILYSLFCSLARCKYLPVFSLSLIFTLSSAGRQSLLVDRYSFVLLTVPMSTVPIPLSRPTPIS